MERLYTEQEMLQSVSTRCSLEGCLSCMADTEQIIFRVLELEYTISQTDNELVLDRDSVTEQFNLPVGIRIRDTHLSLYPARIFKTKDGIPT